MISLNTYAVGRMHVSSAIEQSHESTTTANGHGVVAHDPHEPHERPEDWGWHQEFKIVPRVLGWIAVVALLLMLIGNHSGNVENLWVIAIAALIAAYLIRDEVNRRKAWRN